MHTFDFNFAGTRYTATVSIDGDEITSVYDHREGRHLVSTTTHPDDDVMEPERPHVWRAALGLLDA